jgi:gliding motility-associated-like protein
VASSSFSILGQLAVPAVPTVSVVAPTCTAAGTSSVSNYDNTLTYNFTPAGPTVGSGGAISGMVVGTSYTVTASNASCSSAASSSFSILGQLDTPTAGITNNSGTTILTCTTTSIIVEGTGGTSYSWSGGLGSTAGATITTPGSYTITATGANGCADTELINITQDITAPTAGITNNTGTNELTCNTVSISVTATGGVSYNWSSGLGSTVGATITAPGTYTVTATGENGCSDTEVINVISNTTASQPDVITEQPTCASPTGSITVISVLSANYQFSIGGVYQSGNLFSGLSPGTYEVTSMDVSNGCISPATAIVINPLPSSPVISLVNQENISCSGFNDGQIEVSVSDGLAPYNQSWSPNVGVGLSVGNLTSGDYIFTVTDANGCSVSETFTINQPALLEVSAIVTDVECGSSLGSIETTVTGGTGPFTYAWSPNGQVTPNLSNLLSGNYSVAVTDANGCVVGGDYAVDLIGSLTLSIDPDVASILEGDTVELLASGATSYVWTPATGLSCNDCPNPIARPLTTTTYFVTGTDPNTGCEGYTSMTIFVEQICDAFFAPNIFSPSEDGPDENNTLCIAGECILELNYQVFNRWGELVFETTDNSVCWDGMYKGKPVGSGVYAYKLYARLANGTTVERSGSLTVVY